MAAQRTHNTKYQLAIALIEQTRIIIMMMMVMIVMIRVIMIKEIYIVVNTATVCGGTARKQQRCDLHSVFQLRFVREEYYQGNMTQNA